MATRLENLQTILDNLIDQYLSYSAVISTSGNDVESYSIEGQSMTRASVLKKMQSLQEQIEQQYRLIQIAGGHYEVRSYGVPW